MPYKIVERTPTVQEYNAVRLGAGLTVKDELAAERGLSNTLFGVCVVHNEAVVGIGRVIGDAGLFFDIVDVRGGGTSAPGCRQNDYGWINGLH